MKDYSKPNKQFIMIDMYDDSEDCEVQAGVAIPAEHAEAFIAEVERIAVEKFGGATPAETVKAALLPGEIEDLSRAVERLCGYRRTTIEEVKNV